MTILHSELDALTGLLSRSALESRFEAERAAMREGTRHVLIFVDLEGVFAINRSHGYLAGDEVLRQIANLIRHVAGDGALTGRLSGCRFLILIPEMQRDRGIEVANELSRAIEESRIAWKGTVLRVSVWLGVVSLEYGCFGFPEAWLAACSAARTAKVLGRSSVHVSE
jgi:two-component system CheB/CheR fusion protein